VSLGDLLREEVRQGTDIGKKAKDCMNAGKLVPDELTIELTRKKINSPECAKGCIIDGFPRSEVQAVAFDKMLAEMGLEIEKVVYFEVSAEQVVDRLSGRRSCPKCGAVFHVKYNPPKKENVCDRCGGALTHRVDDEEKAIRTRFEVYAGQTLPLTERYRKVGKLVSIDAGAEISKVFGQLVSVLENVGHKN
ncbi:MAG: nucleoside monophosphate kinase, partial [Candidatus Margulisiibacteriota bacterium]